MSEVLFKLITVVTVLFGNVVQHEIEKRQISDAFQDIVRQKTRGNQIHQCPCVLHPESRQCISYDSRYIAVNVEEAILSFIDLSKHQFQASLINGNTFDCRTNECRNCFSLLFSKLNEIGLIPSNYRSSISLLPQDQINPSHCNRYSFQLPRRTPTPPATVPVHVQNLISAGKNFRAHAPSISPSGQNGEAHRESNRQQHPRGEQTRTSSTQQRQQQTQASRNMAMSGGNNNRQNLNSQNENNARQFNNNNNLRNNQLQQQRLQFRNNQALRNSFNAQQRNNFFNQNAFQQRNNFQQNAQNTQQQQFQQPQFQQFQPRSFQNFNNFQQPQHQWNGRFWEPVSQTALTETIRNPIQNAVSSAWNSGNQGSSGQWGQASVPQASSLSVAPSTAQIAAPQSGFGAAAQSGASWNGGGSFGGGGGQGDQGNQHGFGGFGFHHRQKRAANIVGKRFEIGCTERGDSEDDMLALCGSCWTWRQLPENYFPRIINELSCKTDDFCLSGWGECVQQYRNVDVLRKENGKWIPTVITTATCCDCRVRAGTEIHSLVIGGKK